MPSMLRWFTGATDRLPGLQTRQLVCGTNESVKHTKQPWCHLPHHALVSLACQASSRHKPISGAAFDTCMRLQHCLSTPRQELSLWDSCIQHACMPQVHLSP